MKEASYDAIMNLGDQAVKDVSGDVIMNLRNKTVTDLQFEQLHKNKFCPPRDMFEVFISIHYA